MTYTIEAIVAGTNHHNTLSIVRSLGKEGISVKLLIYGDKESYIAKSKYVSLTRYFNVADDIVNYLKDNSTLYNTLVVICTDELSYLINQEFETLSQSYTFSNIGGNKNISDYMDKELQSRLAVQAGLVVPKTLIYDPHTFNPIPKAPYPCIIKPLESIHGGKQISICFYEEEYISVIKSYSKNNALIIQSFLTKEEEVVLVGLSLEDNIYIPGYVLKHRETKGGTTFSTVYPIDSFDEQIVKATKKLIELIGYKGLFGVEFIKSKENYYFIEINLRNDATCYSICKAGVNLPYIYYLSVIKQSYQHLLSERLNTINSIVEFPDFANVLKKQISFFKWYKDFKSSECRYYFDEEDQGPYKVYLKKYLRWLCGMVLKIK